MTPALTTRGRERGTKGFPSRSLSSLWHLCVPCAFFREASGQTIPELHFFSHAATRHRNASHTRHNGRERQIRRRRSTAWASLGPLVWFVTFGRTHCGPKHIGGGDDGPPRRGAQNQGSWCPPPSSPLRI